MKPVLMSTSRKGQEDAARSRRARAFSLVELLVTVGIIAILVGLLFPAVSRIREFLNTSKCGSNIRQVGQAMQMYAGDHDGVYPAIVNQIGSKSYCYAYLLTEGGYIDKKSGVFRCPTDPNALSNIAVGKTPRTYALIYPAMLGMGAQMTVAKRQAFFTAPSRTGMLGDWVATGGWNYSTVEGSWAGGMGDDNVATDDKAKQTSGHRNGSRSYCFLDGHVEFLTPEQSRNNELWGKNLPL